MEDVLLREGVYSATEGEDVSTADRNRALGLIRMHVDNSIRADLESAELSTPAKVWAHLKKQYKTTAAVQSFQLRDEWHSMRQESGEVIAAYARKAQGSRGESTGDVTGQ